MIIGWVRSLSQMGDKKSLEFNKGAMKHPHVEERQWRPPQSGGSVERDLSLQVGKAASQLIMPKAA